jgi:type I restriction enzyme S subunit
MIMTNNNSLELLEKYFDTAIASPDGIKRLRELILSLAMQGKLVPQDPNDQPASELLKEIEVEKERLINAGKIKESKSLAKIKLDEIPCDLPPNWKWIKLNDLSIKIHYGYTASANHDLKDIRLLRITDIQDNKVNWQSVPGCEIKEKDIPQYLLSNNDILIARTGGTVGKSYLVENINVNAVFASYLIRVVPSKNIYVNYLKLFIESPLYWKQLYEKCSGTGQPNVNGTALSNLLLTLPPLAEQYRIVKKIDFLMAQCDELEKLRAKCDKKRLIVHSAARDRLLNPKDDQSAKEAWDFIRNNFSDLYSVKENVKELRKAILQLAVMGKLVPQDPNDKSASELLKEIEAEKEKLIKAGKMKKSKSLPDIKLDEIPYEIPKNWQWIRLGDIGDFINGDRGKNYPNKEEYVDEGIAWINTGHIKPDGSLNKDTMYFITREKFNKLGSGKIETGDLVYCLRGATFGKTAIINQYKEGAIASSLMIIRPFSTIFNRYLYQYLISPIGRSQIFIFDNGSAQPNLSANSVRLYVYPLPPLPEQHRIVAKVDQLMTLCDKLEQQIDQSTNKQTDLLNAIMSKI